MFVPGERVAVAVSGGPDSILLLEFMRQFSQESGLTLAITHFNHHLRGAESDADEQFVAERAAQLGLELIRGGAEVARVAQSKRENLEATARDLRYRFFLSLISRQRVDKVATGHNANDQAETVLLRLLRGSGGRGLGGIYPMLDGKIARPFLNLTRGEIEREIQERGLKFRLDSSNQDPRFARNRVRLKVLPLLEAEFNPGVVILLKDLAGRARDDEVFLEEAASARARSWRIRDGGREKIALRPLAQFPPALQRRVLRHMLLSACGNVRWFTAAHIESLRRFAAFSQSGKVLDLPGGIRASKEFDWLVIRPEGYEMESREGFHFVIAPPAEVLIPQTRLKFRFFIAENLPKGAPETEYNYGEAVQLDLAKVRDDLILRNWRPGDRFQPVGSRRASKVKEFFLKRRIPASSRGLWPVLLSASQIVWVDGFPPAQGYAASASTPLVLKIEKTGPTGDPE